MKILMIGEKRGSYNEVNTHNQVWTFGLAQEFERRGIDVVFDKPIENETDARAIIDHYLDLDLDGIDHVIAIGGKWLRYFERIPATCAEMLRARCRGVVAQLHAHGARTRPPCHVNLAICKRGAAPWSKYIGWGADHELLWPEQDRENLQILVDHADYAPGVARRRDLSRAVRTACLDFAANPEALHKYAVSKVLLRQWDGAGFSDLGDPVPPRYEQNRISYADCAAEYRKTTIFCVTHTEDTGQTIIEAAMCGALIVVPEMTAGERPLVPPDRLATVRHVSYANAIPWPEVLATVNLSASRETAIVTSTWSAVVDRILDALEETAAEYGRAFRC